ncbi:16S rRNA (guanine(527)-N(7))-methyltransferase RsmG [Devosia sp. 1566]|uniref:16S rRNA (guanine(527)-N(7))-methyltransferase RsmG n=1 Tax=Devosia sp. 1566 TaxID=2499144 RepID=UPI0020BD8A8F|nr:16S rRNA (guanine(527)-N(7))-methyltransferase RsmG [Devosia sp. 1566]
MPKSSIERYTQYFSRSRAEVEADLQTYEGLLRRWQAVQNLVSRETLDQVWTRHFADSLQTLALVRAEDRNFLDLGSGGGLPALPMAIALKETPAQFTLVEPTGRKVSFLRTVARELGLAVTVIPKRSNEIDSRETAIPDVITSRALAALPQLCGMMQPFFGPHTRALLHKGREYGEEISESRALWAFDVVVAQSDTDPHGVLLELTGLRSR